MEEVRAGAGQGWLGTWVLWEGLGFCREVQAGLGWNGFLGLGLGLVTIHPSGTHLVCTCMTLLTLAG